MTDAPNPQSSLWAFTGITSGSLCLSRAGKPRTGPRSSDVSHWSLVEGRIITIHRLAMPFLMQPRMLLATFPVRAHCWLKSIGFFSAGILRSFFAELLSTRLFPSLSWDQHSSPGKRTFHFHLLNLMRFPSTHFSTLSRPLKFGIIIFFNIVATDHKHGIKSTPGLGRQGKTFSKT